MDRNWRERFHPVMDGAFLARRGAATPYQRHKLCFFASDLELLGTVLDTLADEPDCAFVKLSERARGGVYLGRCFYASPDAVGEVWARYKAHPELHCVVQDDGLTGPHRDAVWAWSDGPPPPRAPRSRLRSDLPFPAPAVTREVRPDGTEILRSATPLGEVPRCVGVWLAGWAEREPDRTFLAERAGEGWRRVGYGEALAAVRRIGGALLRRGLGPDRPVAILSDNGVDHALLALGAMHVGVPVAPISVAYSLASTDHAKLREVVALLRPGLVYASDPERYGPALAAIDARATAVDELLAEPPDDDAVDRAHAAIGPDTVAKILFTSGSTGSPKGVINTQRMLCASQVALARGWPFVEERPPILVDWLPWSHTFGGNHNFHLVLRNGGTLYVDGGKPAPGAIDVTVRNLQEIAPTLYFNVPRGYDLLLPHLERDEALCRTFFSRLDVLFYAGAALPQNLWTRIEDLAVRTNGGRLAMLSAWGSTETSPLATQVHTVIDRAGVVGVPVPGCELKLVPSGDKREVRVRGPNVTPGYLGRPDLTAAAFDEEGFYRIGDAMRLADPARPEAGLVFDGRVAEDFKLTSGTWVHVGAVRTRFVAAADPVVSDAVVTGHDRHEIGVIVFLGPAARDLGPEAVRARIAAAMRAMAADGAGSSMRPTRAIVADHPPSLDAGEITDKGYLNQRAVLSRRAALVERLYGDDPEVIRG